MKKITAMLTALAMLSCCLVSCGDSDDESEKTSRKTSSSSQIEEKTEPQETEPAHHKALRKFIEALNGYNVDSCMKFLMPQYVIEAYDQDIQEANYDFIADFVERYNEEIKGECGDDAVTALGEILSEEKLSEDQLELSKKYFMQIGVPDDEKLIIKEGYEITYVIDTVGEYGEDSDENTSCIIRIENDGWKIFLGAADELLFYDENYFPSFDDDVTTTAAVTTAAVTTTTTTAVTQPTTSIQIESPTVSVSPDYAISSFPTLDFMSFVMGLNPIWIGGENVYSYEIAMLPSNLYNKMSGNGQVKEYNKETLTYAIGIRSYVSQGDGKDHLSIDNVENMQLLTDEELNKVSGYYYNVMSRYGITDVPVNLIGGYSADVYIKSDADSSSAKPVRMICVTTDTSDSSVLPCGIDEIDSLIP